MALDPDRTLYAQVVLKSASGRRIDGTARITADTLADYAPAPATVDAARRGFEAAGLEPGPVSGVGFGLEGTVETFEKVFDVQLTEDPEHGVRAEQGDGPATSELPLGALSDDLARHLEAVTFTPPPDFGPTDFMGP